MVVSHLSPACCEKFACHGVEPVVVLVEEHTDAVLLEVAVEVEVVDNLLLVELVVAEPPPGLIVRAACLSN